MVQISIVRFGSFILIFTKDHTILPSAARILTFSILFDCSRLFLLPRYIGNLLLLISCQHEKFGHQIQKHVKEAIGNELNPLIYPILFNQLRAHVDACFSGQGQQQVVVTETNTLFIENVIFIMRSILDKRTKPVDRTNGHLEVVSIESLMLNIVR